VACQSRTCAEPLPDLTFTKVDFEILHTAVNAVAS
jgi:hypothetical protein